MIEELNNYTIGKVFGIVAMLTIFTEWSTYIIIPLSLIGIFLYTYCDNEQYKKALSKK